MATHDAARDLPRRAFCHGMGAADAGDRQRAWHFRCRNRQALHAPPGPKTAARLFGQGAAGQAPRRPPLGAYRDELERRRQATARARTADTLTKLQQKFYEVALSDLKGRGIDVDDARTRGGRLLKVRADLAAQILLLIQRRAREWVEQGRIPIRWVRIRQTAGAKRVYANAEARAQCAARLRILHSPSPSPQTQRNPGDQDRYRVAQRADVPRPPGLGRSEIAAAITLAHEATAARA